VEVNRLNEKIAVEKTRAKAADERLTAQGAEIEELKAHLKRTEEDKKARSALFNYFWLLTLVLLSASVAAWQAESFFPNWDKIIGVNPIRGLLAVLVFVVGHLLLEFFARRNQRMARLWPLKQIKRFRQWLWALVVMSFVLGVIGNLYANRIQKQIDLEPSAPSSSERGSSPIPKMGINMPKIGITAKPLKPRSADRRFGTSLVM
jgi:magnesium-transporting ATPase (P-type)